MYGLNQSAGFVLYASGILALPVGLLLYGIGLDGESSSTRALRLAALLTALVTGPGAVALELGGVYPDLGWTLWGVGTGVGWLLIGSLLLARHREDGPPGRIVG